MQLLYSVQKILVAESSQENFLGQQSPNFWHQGPVSLEDGSSMDKG